MYHVCIGEQCNWIAILNPYALEQQIIGKWAKGQHQTPVVHSCACPRGQDAQYTENTAPEKLFVTCKLQTLLVVSAIHNLLL